MAVMAVNALDLQRLAVQIRDSVLYFYIGKADGYDDMLAARYDIKLV